MSGSTCASAPVFRRVVIASVATVRLGSCTNAIKQLQALAEQAQNNGGKLHTGNNLQQIKSNKFKSDRTSFRERSAHLYEALDLLVDGRYRGRVPARQPR